MKTTNYSSLPEKDLMELVINGQYSLFETIIKRYQKDVLNFLAYKTYSKHDAEDLVQETFIKAYLFIEKGFYKNNGYLKTWLLQIAYNTYIDWQRSKKSRPQREMDSADCGERIIMDSATPERLLITKESLAIIDKNIQKLPLSYSTVAQLRHYEGMSYNSIAETLALPIGTVKTRLYIVKNKLSKVLSRNLLEA